MIEDPPQMLGSARRCRDGGQPRSMRDPFVRQRRREMLTLPHIVPLATYAESLRGPGKEVPDFDPMDGGTNARVLFLFEKPGPMTAANRRGRAGSGFISRDNDDPTAEATFDFMRKAGIPREQSILWNVVPWWNGTRKIVADELQQGVRCLDGLLSMLGHVGAIVLVGKKAAKARPMLEPTALGIFTSLHPSPLVRARQPDDWLMIPEEWSDAWRYLERLRSSE